MVISGEASERFTVISAVVALSSVVVTSEIVRSGGGQIINVPVASSIVALLAFERVRIAVSIRASGPSASLEARLFTGTSIIFVVSPAANFNVPLTAVKSDPAVAVPSELTKSTVTVSFDWAESETTNVAVLENSSLVVKSAIDKLGNGALLLLVLSLVLESVVSENLLLLVLLITEKVLKPAKVSATVLKPGLIGFEKLIEL